VVFVPDRAVADWYRDQVALDTRSGAWLRPWFFTPADVPLIVDEAAAVRPARVLFSAMCHLDDTNVEEMYPALLAALATLEPTTKIFYHNVTVGRLPAADRARWEAFLVTTAVGKRTTRSGQGRVRGATCGSWSLCWTANSALTWTTS
jgi:hypothetical protein